jgi:hypothetical protein
MKLVQSLVVAALVALPVVSFAQSNQPVTRAQVRAELIQLQQAGYNPASDQTQYPKNIEAAEARISASNSAATTSYGAPGNATSASGSPSGVKPVIGLGPIYAHP